MGGTERASGRGALPYVMVLAFAALPPVALELYGLFGDKSVPPGQCEGLGFGCALSPAETARLFLLFVLPVMALWAVVAVIGLALLRRRAGFRDLPAIVQGLLPVVPALLIFVALVFV
ncbi:hypothetical protein [Actinomadura sp. DC4]|uniref:hypothetical protein n=1 Tax=Actinomadura sp. DC4 TaxID=3055069 RepID=UPI0025B1E7E4|nr:hypothetical protein [Actinomadura sp. DC4]MDN3356901.1 hypothetical protein [Actinomadura sp. DC4]